MGNEISDSLRSAVSQENTQELKTSDVLSEFARSASYTAIVAPTIGATQFLDKTIGKAGRGLGLDIPEFDVNPQEYAPAKAEFGSSTWFAQVTGSALGMVPLFKGLRAVSGTVGDAVLTKTGSSILELGSNTLVRKAALNCMKTGRFMSQTEVGKSVAAGISYGALFAPTTADETFVASRVRNAAVGALTFGTLTKSIGKISSYGESLPAGSLGKVFANNIGAGVVAGVPTGFVNYETHSLLSGKGLKFDQGLAESICAYSLVGGMSEIASKASRAINTPPLGESDMARLSVRAKSTSNAEWQNRLAIAREHMTQLNRRYQASNSLLDDIAVATKGTQIDHLEALVQLSKPIVGLPAVQLKTRDSQEKTKH